MGVFYESIPDNIYEWILQQQVFWVATAPLSRTGHVNVSPKGGPYFGLIDARTFWYMDLTGSGNETISHLRENGRITVNFNAFVGAPKIVRLWGTGRVMERGTKPFDQFVRTQSIELMPGTRSIIVVDVHQVGSSCGFSVPFFEFKGWRDTLNNFWEKKRRAAVNGNTDAVMPGYWAHKNAWSIDGLPGMQSGLECAERENIQPLVKMIGPMAPPAPFGPKSWRLSTQLKYRVARLRKTKVDLLDVMMIAAVALLVGALLGLYLPAIMASQRARLERLLL